MRSPYRVTSDEALQALRKWTRKHVLFQGDLRLCKHCRHKIEMKTVSISCHIEEFFECAGDGRVTELEIPYCPQCEPEPEDGCIHFPIDAEHAKRFQVVKGEHQKAVHAESMIGCQDWPGACSHTPKCEPQSEGARVINDMLRRAEVRSPKALAADEEILIVCLRTTRPAYVPGAKARIAGCGCEVWMAPSTQEIMAHGVSYTRVICMEHAEERVRNAQAEAEKTSS